MKISVIIPVYNLENYLEECIESVINQTLKEIEIICINDGSTDNSLEILKNYSNIYSNIRIINQVNSGQGFSRNLAMDYATGEYIYFLDGDDYLNNEALMICYNEAKKNDLDILTFDATVFYDKNYTGNIEYNLERKDYLESKIKNGIQFIEEAISQESSKEVLFRTEHWLNLYKREFLKKNNIKFGEQKEYEDVIQVFDSFIFAKKVKYITNKLLYRRIRNQSSSTSEPKKINVDGLYKASIELIDRYYKVESYGNLYLQKCILHKIQYYINLTIEMCDYLGLENYKNEIIKDIYSKINIINLGIKTIKSPELMTCFMNCDLLNKCINQLYNENLTKNEFIDIVKKLLAMLERSSSYNELVEFKKLEEVIFNILSKFDFSYKYNNEDIINLKKCILNLLNKIRKSINIFFYGSDKYNLLNDSVNNGIIYINDIEETKNLITKEFNKNINILIISEETVPNNIEITQYFDNIIYYDKVMNYLFEVSERVYYNNYDCNYLIKSLEKAVNKDTKTIIVGNSYPLYGIEENLLKDNSIKLALGSQDLYYAYKLAENVINKNSNIKRCIIGSGYYLVNHDLSRAKHSDSVSRVKYVYYPVLKDKHNSKNVEDIKIIELKDVIDDVLLKEIFDLGFLYKHFKELVYRENNGYFNKSYKRKVTSLFKNLNLSCISEEEKIEIGKWRADQHNKLEKYSQTKEEFKGIFEEFIEFLKSKNVKPILVVFPATKYYKNYLDKRYKEEFYEIVSKINKDNAIDIIDLFESDIFTEDDFIDFDHLDDSGAIKVTNELNRRIFNN